MFAKLCLAVSLMTACTAGARADLLVNGDFETGTLLGWQVIGIDGDFSAEGVVPFDVTGSGASLAAAFQAGQPRFPVAGQPGGGALEQVFDLPAAGTLDVSFDYAAFASSANGDAGTFSLLLDGNVLQSVSLGAIDDGQTLRGTLSGAVDADAGPHTLELEATRDFRDDFGTPVQYFDNARASIAAPMPVGEPLTIGLFGAGLAGARILRRRAR